MKVSVIIPTYKPQDYLWECLESLDKQTLSKDDFEIIVILNGCCEPWKGLILEWIKKYPQLNMHFIHTGTPGVSNARNKGIDVALGEYITFIDDDDYVSPQYLEQLLLFSTPDCVALSDCLYVNDKTKEISIDNPHHRKFIKYSKKTFPTIFETRTYFNGPCMKLIHKSIVGSRRFDINFKNGEDTLMMFLISNKIKKIRISSSDAIYYRRVRANSANSRMTKKKEVMVNNVKMFGQYLKYISRDPFNYNMPFVLARFVALIKTVIIR